MKNEQAITSWLRKKATTAVVLHCAGAACLVLFAALLLFLTLWIVYVVIYLAVDWLVPLTHATRFWLSAGVVALIVVSYLTIDYAQLKSEMLEAHLEDHDPVAAVVGDILGLSALTTSPRVLVKASALFFCYGPHLLAQVPRVLRVARAWQTIDLMDCTAVLARLSRKDERVSLEEIKSALPAGHDSRAVVRQVRLFDGVLYLRSHPVGLKLTEEFRKELRELKKATSVPGGPAG